ncbi:MAG: Wzt carbohydrate-binding domain-containing protein [Bacillota bacterium]
MKNKYFFLHIPKTAGSSLYVMFNELLGAENVRQVDDLRNFGPLQAQRLKKYRLVGGHFIYPQRLLFEKDRYSITFLRNPVDRFLSQYYFFRSNSFCEVAASHNLAQYIDHFKRQKCGGVMNVHIWHLTGQIDTTLSMNDLLEMARENLSNVDFVGIREFFADSLDLLCYECKWPAVQEIPVENVTGERSKVQEIDENIIDRIKELNRYDMDLYEHCLGLFNLKKRNILREWIVKNRAEAEAPYSLKIESPESGGRQPDSQTGLGGGDGGAFDSPANFGTHEVRIISAGVFNDSGLPEIKSGGEAVIRIFFRSSIAAASVTLGFGFEDEYRQTVYGTNSYHLGLKIPVEEGKTYCAEYRLRMNIGEGRYKLNVSLHTGPDHLEKCFHWWEHVCNFTVAGYEKPYCVGIAKLYPRLEVEVAGEE